MLIPRLILILIILVSTVYLIIIISDASIWYNPPIEGMADTSNEISPKPSQIIINNNSLNNIPDKSLVESNMLSEIPSNMSTNSSYSINYNNGGNREVCKKSNESVKCSTKTCGMSNLYPILDPRFNMRESAKQCLLLEDHLNNKKKRCTDCIRKHFLIIDGLLEEAISLEKDNSQRNYYRNLHISWVNIEKQYAKSPSDSNTIDDVSKLIRIFRKPLVEDYFDMISEYDD
jgi:hypothetical protein